MALNKQIISLNFGQGIDTKTDSKHLQAGKLSNLENAEFSKMGRIDKATGFTELPTQDFDGNELTNPDSIATFGDELLLYRDQTLYTLATGSDKWANKGNATSGIVRTTQVIKNIAQQTQVDFATNAGITVFAYADSRGGVRATVIDEESGTSLLADVLIDSAGSKVKVISFTDYIYVFYYEGSSVLKARRLNPVQATTFETEVTICSDIDAVNTTYDVINYRDTRILLAYNNTTGNQSTMAWYDQDLAQLSGILSPVTVANDFDKCVALVDRTGYSEIYLLFEDAGDVKRIVYNNGLAELQSVATIETVANVNNITGYADSTGIIALYDVTPTNKDQSVIRTANIDSDGTVGTPADLVRSVSLWSKAFIYTSSEGTEYPYVCTLHDSTLQATYFLIDASTGRVVAKMQPNVGGSTASPGLICNVEALTSSKFGWPVLNKTRIISENATLYTPLGVARTSIDFANEDIFVGAELGGNLHIVGGILSMYDGDAIVEHGFHLYPERVSLAQSASGGSMSNGTYQVVCLYEWTDAKGQIHRSAPSLPVTIVVNGGGSSQKITVTFPTLRLTEKDGTTRTNVSLVCFRTEDLGSIFYRATSITSPTDNDVTANSVSIDLTIDDTALISNEILYTTGGVLDNLPAPACSSISVFKNRLFLAGLENENDFWYSKEYITGRAVEFNDTLKKNVEPAGGRIVTTAVLDDKLAIFKKDRFFITFGDGPNALGQLGDFAKPQFISADVGCKNAESVVRMPDGIMFKSTKGFYLLDSSLGVTYIGSEVEDFNNLTTTSGILLAKNNQVRFTHSDGSILVYDYFFGQWSTRPNLSSKDAVVWQDEYVMLQGDRILKSDSTVYKIGDSAQNLKLETGWIYVGDITGFQRVWRAFIVGEYKSTHKLKVKVAYDFGPYIDIFYFDADTALGIGKYGDDSPYGSGSPYGGINNAYRFMMHLSRQKCQSIKFLIEELTSGGTFDSQASLSISDIGLLIGTSRGHAKLRQQQTIGDS